MHSQGYEGVGLTSVPEQRVQRKHGPCGPELEPLQVGKDGMRGQGSQNQLWKHLVLGLH